MYLKFHKIPKGTRGIYGSKRCLKVQLVPKGPGLPNGLISDLFGWLITNIIEGASFCCNSS